MARLLFENHRRELQKSEAMPLVSQSPYRVGSGPCGPWNSFGTGLASAVAACRRASASASARFAAGDNGFRSGEGAGVGAVVTRCEESSVIANFQPRDWSTRFKVSTMSSHPNYEVIKAILTFGIFRCQRCFPF
jgi:hypothetical protein